MRIIQRISRALSVIFWLAVSTVAAGAAPAQPCDQRINDNIAERFKIGGFVPDGAIVASACKVWPKDDKSLIAAYVYFRGIYDEVQEFDVLVTLSNKDASEISAVYESKMHRNAAIHLSEGGLSIDTARYDLSASVRAFGIRFSRLDDSGANDYLTLFVPEGERLRPVLDGVSTFGEHRYNDGPLFYRVTIALGEKSHNRMKDLVVNTRYFVVDGEGKDVETRKERRVMAYDGSEYEYTEGEKRETGKPCICEQREYKECDSGGYYVIYPETVSSSRAGHHYYAGCKGEGYPSLYDYCASSAGESPRYEFEGEGLPAPKYSTAVVLFNSEAQARALAKHFPASEVVKDYDVEYDMWDTDWVLQVKDVTANTELEQFKVGLKKLAPQAHDIVFQPDDGIITFGECMSKKDADKLAAKVNKTGTKARVLHLRRVEYDL